MLILGGQCDENLNCVQCYREDPPLVNQFGYKYSQCRCDISRCVGCASAKTCFICSDNRLPIPNSAKPGESICKPKSQMGGNCPTDFGYSSPFKHNCTQCPQNCKFCDYTTVPGGCTECQDPLHKAVEYSQSEYYQVGHPKHGVAECVDPNTVIKGFFTDSSVNYKKCLSGCSQCSDATTCSQCEDPDDPAAVIYHINTQSPHRCTKCLQSSHEFLTEENTKKCVACPAGQRLKKGGVSSADCTACSAGSFVDNDGYCEECLGECSECSDRNGCSACKVHNLQPDKSCKEGCPTNYKADSA